MRDRIPALRSAVPSPSIGPSIGLYNFDFAGAHLILDDQHRRITRMTGLRMPCERPRCFSRNCIDCESSKASSSPRTSESSIRRSSSPTNNPDCVCSRSTNSEQRRIERFGPSPTMPTPCLRCRSRQGLRADYTAFVDKRQLQSLSVHPSVAKLVAAAAKSHPNYADAELTCRRMRVSARAVCRFFVRWFVRFDGVEGQKSVATQNWSALPASGRYLGPFARILLAIVHLREKQPAQALAILKKLSRDFPKIHCFEAKPGKCRSDERPLNSLGIGAEHAKKIDELREVPEGFLRNRVVRAPEKIQVEPVFPWFPA